MGSGRGGVAGTLTYIYISPDARGGGVPAHDHAASFTCFNSGRDETALELRMRTVQAVRDTELCYLTRSDVHGLYAAYPELRARMNRFASAGRVLTERALRALDLSRCVG